MDLKGYLEFASLAEPVPLRAIVPSPAPVREDVGDLRELIDSIHTVGLVHPILVRPIRGDKFEIVAGTRRFEACKALHWTQIPAIIREMNDQEAYEIALTENVQRKSMNPIEEAVAFRRYVDREGWGGASRLAQRLGKSKSFISQRLFLLSLPIDVQNQLRSGEIAPCVARQLSGVEDPSVREEIAHEVSTLRLSTRSTSLLVKSLKVEDPAETDHADFDPKLEQFRTNDQTSVRTLQQAILAVRLAMARLDILRRNCEYEDPEVGLHIHEMRLELHRMIDDTIRKKILLARRARVIEKGTRATRLKSA